MGARDSKILIGRSCARTSVGASVRCLPVPAPALCRIGNTRLQQGSTEINTSAPKAGKTSYLRLLKFGAFKYFRLNMDTAVIPVLLILLDCLCPDSYKIDYTSRTFLGAFADRTCQRALSLEPLLRCMREKFGTRRGRSDPRPLISYDARHFIPSVDEARECGPEPYSRTY